MRNALPAIEVTAGKDAVVKVAHPLKAFISRIDKIGNEAVVIAAQP